MPGFIRHAGATVICFHAGQAQPTAVNPRVLVGGQPTVTLSAPYVIAGCGLTGSPNPPCATAQFVSSATRLLSGGVPLLLQDSQATCVPTGTGLQILVTQVRARGQ